MADARPVISVIIPVWRVEKYLRRCLDSVVAQTHPGWEAICINDGSPDACGDILAEYAARDARFKIISKENAGVCAARNDGVRCARGDYIIFLDSDDFIHPQLFEIVHGLACENGADIVSFRYDADARKCMEKILKAGGDITKFTPKSVGHLYNTRRLRCRRTNNLMKYATERNHAYGAFRVRHCYPVMHLIRRDFLSGISFDTSIKLAEDFPWWTNILFRAPRAVILTLPLYYYVPNVTSALNAASAQHEFKNMSRATLAAYKVAAMHENTRAFKIWTREFLWPFMISVARVSRRFDGGQDAARTFFSKMYKVGALNNPYGMRARKYRRRILKLLGVK